jgi:UDP-3-O-[3-hydroxymyristoyl] glucosamine N-acyltransferase
MARVETALISPRAVVETDRVGAGVHIAEGAIIRSGAVLGDRVVIHPHVIIETGVEIGDGTEIFSGSVLGKEPKGASVTRTPSFRPVVRVGEGGAIGPNAVLYYDVEVGPDALIGDGASIREGGRLGKGVLLGRHVTLNYDVQVGDRTKVMDLTHITGGMRIGDDVFISVGVLTANDNAMGRLGASALSFPVIESEAAIGAGAILLPGVVIGRGAVVGAGAVVTKDVAPGSRAMGVPAREG